MTALQVFLVTSVFGCAISHPQVANTYGVPPQFSSFRYLQDYPARHTVALARPLAPAPAPVPQVQNDQLELLPPLQHVVGTRYPAVDPGPGFRFPLSQILNPTPPPNLLH